MNIQQIQFTDPTQFERAFMNEPSVKQKAWMRRVIRARQLASLPLFRGRTTLGAQEKKQGSTSIYITVRNEKKCQRLFNHYNLLPKQNSEEGCI